MASRRPNGSQRAYTLEELYAQHQGKVSDKWFPYLGQYERLLKAFRAQTICLLEIGVQNGGSLEIWGRYFHAARRIVGVDCDPKCSSLVYEDPRIAVVVGDANSNRTQQTILEQASEFDVIIDDGSHQSGDIVKAFARYFPVLSAGGLYIVEDVHCSYWHEYQGGLYHPFSAIAFFKRLADVVNHEHWGIDRPPTELLGGFCSQYGFGLDQAVLESVYSVEFTNSLCVIRRRGSDDAELFRRVVAGTEEPVWPGLKKLNGTPTSSPCQKDNAWTARNMPPEEELPLRLEELAEKVDQITLLNAELAQHRTEIAQLNNYVAGLKQAITKRDEHISGVHQTISERDRYIKAVERELTERRTHVAELETQVHRLEGGLQAAKAKVKERDSKMRKRDEEVKAVRRQTARLKAELAEVYASRSWRITKPLRVLSPVLRIRWILRNTRRALKLLGWFATGQFGRAGSALLPYCRRFVPERIKGMIPEKLRVALRHLLETELHLDPASAITVLPGHRQRDPKAKTVLVCAHGADKAIYGAERSFLDVVEALSALGMNVVITIPVRNEPYIESLLPFVVSARCFPYPWWREHRGLDEVVIALFQRTMLEESADAVHVNTIMLREPLLAARRLRIPVIVHAREIIQHDMALCYSIGKASEEIASEVAESADYVVANSEATARSYGCGGRTIVLPNTVDVDELDIPNEVDPSAVCFALISSNIPKKGVEDVVKLAQLCVEEAPNAHFLLVGPHSGFVERLRKRCPFPDNLRITGYQRSPQEAVSLANVVLNFSHFAESFGRTVLEGMAARRPAIAYNWGALPELIKHGETGYLVPFRSPEKAVEYVKLLVSQPELIARLGAAGRQLAVERYSQEVFTRKLRSVYGAVLADKAEQHPRQPPRISVVVPNYNCARYLQDRLESIFSQSLRPLEIVFLDDASTDNSLAVAKSLLEESSIPYKIIRHTTNVGTYRQWLKGIEEAEGELVWIAEADDCCEPDMLASLAAAMEDERVTIAYCQSKRIDENGTITASDNLQHTDALDRERWKEDYRELGLREVVDYLVYRNTIPNSSACLLRKTAIAGVEEELSRARFCGDRLLYAHMLKRGNVAYQARPMNSFRRHSASVTHRRGKSIELLEEVVRVRRYICDNFPVHPSQLDRMDAFLDRDYRVEGVEKNSGCPAIKHTLEAIAAQVGRNRRFAFITTNNASFDGGSELWWRDSAKRLRALGHDVIVLIKRWNPRPPFLSDFEYLGIKPYFKEERGFGRIVDFEPDLVVLSLGDQDEGTEYYSELRKHDIPYIIVNRLTKEPRFWPVHKDRNEKVREGYLNAEKVFFASRNNHQVMEKRLGCQLPRWGRIYSPCHADRDAQLPFPPFSNGVKLAVPAKIEFVHKGQDMLVEVMKQSKWRQREITINLYGEGRDSERLRQMVKAEGLEDKFAFHGKIAFVGREHEISNIWVDNHAVLMASRMEGFPNMVINAMLSGRVPIVPDIGGHSEAIEDGVSGFIATQPSPEALDEAMERAYQRRHQWEQMGQRAKEAASNYLPEDPLQDAVDKILSVVGLEMNLSETAKTKDLSTSKQAQPSTPPAITEFAGGSRRPAACLAYRDLLTQSLFSPQLHVPYAEQVSYYIAFLNSYARTRAQQFRSLPQTERVSIIMPTYNRAPWIGVAIRSVLAQSYANWELIIVDDGSTDETGSVVASFRDQRVVYRKLESNEGCAAARNAGLELASGGYVAYLDSDNTIHPDFLLILVHELEEDQGLQLAYCAQRVYEVNGGKESEAFIRFAPFHWPSMENHHYVDLGSIVHRRSMLDSTGGFNVQLERLIDWEFILRCTAGKGAKAVPAVLSNYYRGKTGDQITLVKPYAEAVARVDAWIKHKPVRQVLPSVSLQSIEEMYSLPYEVPEPSERRPVSIVIPSYEAVTYLQACVEAVDTFTDGYDCELIVVDNASSQPVRSYLETLADQSRANVLFNHANLGFSYAVNQGIHAASPGNDIVILNNDAVVTKGWLSALQSVLSDYPDVGLVAPTQTVLGGEKTLRIHRPDRNPQRQCDINISAHHANVLDPVFDIPRGYMELSFAPFFCVYIPRSTVDLIGVLDAVNGPHYRSDRLYCDMVREQGLRILYTPHSRVYHLVKRATEDLKERDPNGYKHMFVENDWTKLSAYAMRDACRGSDGYPAKQQERHEPRGSENAAPRPSGR